MRFCKVCENLLYVQVNGPDGDSRATPELAYACKSCGLVEKVGTTARVIDTNYRDDESAWRQFVTPYIRHDPTLPRVSNIPCPSTACTRPAKDMPEVIYVKYNVRELRFLYHCCHCGLFWKSAGGHVEPEGGNKAVAAPAPS